MHDLANKTVLVTGANSGIGLEACVKLARMGATVVMVARDEKKLESAIADVKARGDSTRISGLLCDFSVQARIHDLAKKFVAGHDHLDVLVNNAGTVNDVRRVTTDGFERTFAVNHLGYFTLTNLLLPLLQKSAPARIVNVSSGTHRKGDLDWDDLQMEKGYFIMRAYTRSKLANVLFTRELAKRLEGTGVTVNALHPGGVATNIYSGAPWYAKPLVAMAKLFMDTPEQGGDTLVYLASSADVEGKTGGYYEKNTLVDPAPLAQDDAVAKKLWSVSESLTSAKAI